MKYAAVSCRCKQETAIVRINQYILILSGSYKTGGNKLAKSYAGRMINDKKQVLDRGSFKKL